MLKFLEFFALYTVYSLFDRRIVHKELNPYDGFISVSVVLRSGDKPIGLDLDRYNSDMAGKGQIQKLLDRNIFTSFYYDTEASVAYISYFTVVFLLRAQKSKGSLFYKAESFVLS